MYCLDYSVLRSQQLLAAFPMHPEFSSLIVGTQDFISQSPYSLASGADNTDHNTQKG
jgi:hypothetical protein